MRPDVLRILYVDDDKATAQQMKDLYDGETIASYKIEMDTVTDFDKAIESLQRSYYDVAVLDVYRGKPELRNKDLEGEQVLERIKKTIPVVVILYTALPAKVKHLESAMVKVLSKAEDDLGDAIKDLIESGIPILKKKLMDHFVDELTMYYWEFAEGQPALLSTAKDDHLFEHLLTRRLASTLDEDGATKIFGGSIPSEKVHPWRMYIIPPSKTVPDKMGQIVCVEDDYWIVLTPSCDFAQKNADYVLIASCSKLTDNKKGKKLVSEYKKAKGTDKEVAAKNNLDKFIKSNMGDRYFFLPSIDILSVPSLVVDLQLVRSNEINDFQKEYKVVAELDAPYAQDLQAKFTRYNNRPGTPDIETAELIDGI